MALNVFANGTVADADEVNENFNYLYETLGNSINQNSLDILELQAEASLEGGQSAFMVRDLFSQSDGFLETIDIGGTDAIFGIINKNDVESYTSSPPDERVTTTTIFVTALERGIISSIKIQMGGPGSTNIQATISQNSTTIAQRTFTIATTTLTDFNFLLSDYSKPLEKGEFTIVLTRTSGLEGWRHNPIVSFSGSYFNFFSQRPCSGITFAKANFGYSNNETDKFVQTNKLDLTSTPTHFQVFAYKPETEGTGNIKGEVSFNNGANYQEVDLDTPTEIDNTGNELIARIKLNAGASDGLASCNGYGVMFW